MFKRKLEGAVGEPSVDQKICKSNATYITCEKSEGLHLAEPGFTTGRQFGRRNLGEA